MGRKSSAKANTPPPTPAAATPNGSSMRIIVGVVALALAGGGFAYMRSARSQPDLTDAAQSASAAAAIPAGLKPHAQANLPPLQFPGYQMPRSTEVVTAAYKFAAEHPEILSYVPCFCGCE